MGEVISLSKKRKIKKQEEEIAAEAGDVINRFEELQKLAEENEERLKKERAVANKKVLRSYRIKR